MQDEISVFEGLLRRIAGARVFVLLAFHAVVFTACYVFAWLVRFDFSIPQPYAQVMRDSLPYAVLVQLAIAAAFGFFRGWWRYVGITDVVRLAVGVTLSFSALIFLWYLGARIYFQPLAGVSRAVLL